MQRLDSFVKQHWGWWSLLIAVLLFRLPTLCEPYWYGDEGIYLTIGNALRQGRLLYAGIVDHKTPLIYYFAMVPSQLWFRILMMVWMMVTTWCFYQLVSSFGWRRWQTWLSSWIFILLTSLPAFEGNIPNGELFVMGFVLAGLLLLTRTRLWLNLLADPRHARLPSHWSKRDITLTVLAGMSGGLGILTKVPGLFDVAAMAWVGWLVLTAGVVDKEFKAHDWWPRLKLVITSWWWLGLGIVTPIALSVLYFTLRGSFASYLEFGLLYNFHYAGNWQLDLPWPWLAFWFTLPGKMLIMAVGLLLVTAWQRWQSQALSWSLGWLLLALFGSLLSNRPYPHYFLQLVPALSIVVVAWLGELTHLKQYRYFRDKSLVLVVWLATAALVALIPVSLLLLKFGMYPTLSYYQNWWQVVTGQISRETYYQRFNWIIPDNTRAANIIRSAGAQEIFIWGTNPMLYAVSQTAPTGRFTVAFHIKDINAFDETMRDLVADPPLFVVVMNEDAETWPEMQTFLTANAYQPNYSFEHFVLWKRPSN